MSKNRIKMICRVKKQISETQHDIRQVTQNDMEKIARAMLAAYMGTVDQQEDTYEEALEEVERIFNNEYGPLVPEASLLIEKQDEAAAVILVSLFKGTPLIVELFTGKPYYKQGMATDLIKASMNKLHDMGYGELCLYVKEENTGAIRLYRNLGFEEAK